MTELYKKKLTDYIKKNLSKGYNFETLKWSLINQGYSRTAVERAIDSVKKELAEKEKIKEKPVIKYEAVDEDNQPVQPKKSWWRRLFGM